MKQDKIEKKDNIQKLSKVTQFSGKRHSTRVFSVSSYILVLSLRVIHLIFSRFIAYIENCYDSVCKKCYSPTENCVCSNYFLPVWCGVQVSVPPQSAPSCICLWRPQVHRMSSHPSRIARLSSLSGNAGFDCWCGKTGNSPQGNCHLDGRENFRDHLV